jgi:DNA topoisomerase I
VTLVRVDPNGPGLGRRRRGKGFSYHDLTTGEAVTDPATLDRLTALVLPPAWRDVWICPRADGHIQAVGTDVAGRRQYRYHDEWTAQQSREKFARVARLGAHMPEVRHALAKRLEPEGLGRDRVLAGAVWLLDLGVFRVGGEEYADRDRYSEASFGLATLRREHATARRDGSVQFDYVAKAGVQRHLTIADEATHRLVSSLKRRRGGGDELLAWKAIRKRETVWHDVTADDVNDAVREAVGEEFTAKDLRTWNAGVVAAVALATRVDADGSPPGAERKRKAAVTHTMKTVAAQLGNTPAVCRSSYVDPVLVEHFEAGRTVREAVRDADPSDTFAMRDRVEAAVLELVTSRSG